MKRRGFFAALAKAAVMAVACPVILREAVRIPAWRSIAISTKELIEQSHRTITAAEAVISYKEIKMRLHSEIWH